MAYRNNYNNRNNYRNDYRGGGYRNQPKKKSGAKTGIQSKGKNEGKIYVSAWKANKRHGMVSIIGFENGRSVRSESRNGNKFVTIMFEITFKDQGNTMLELGNYNLVTGKVYLERLGWVISTKAPNGGYCGKIKN